MKRFICLLTVLVMCLSLAAPVFGAEAGFVPSITYKPNPEIIPVQNESGEEFIGVIRNESGEIADYVGHGCIMITPIAHVWDEEIEVAKVVEDLLLHVYNSLNDGNMNIPYEKHDADLDPANMVIRDLFDARWVCEEHRAMIEKEGYTFEISFDLGVVDDAQIFVMTYDETEDVWEPIVKTVNEGDGKVTCTFEHLCAIEFSMPVAPSDPTDPTVPSDPSDDFLNWKLLLWILLLILALILAIVVIIILVTKKKKKKSV